MQNVLRSLILALPVLLQLHSKPVYAEEVQPEVSIVLALDISTSMFNGASPRHAAIQSLALQLFLESYQDTCIPIEVTFMPWGDKVGVVESAVINSHVAAAAFSDKIAYDSMQSLGGTKHKNALLSAIRMFTRPDTTKILVFTTDEPGSMNESLKPYIPADVTVYGISLGEREVSGYLKVKVIPDEKLHFHAENSDDFKKVLETVLQQVTNTFCMS
jgi:Protein of unknown function (DUF1194)